MIKGLTDPLMDISTRIFLGVKGGWPERKAAILTAICEPRRITTLWTIHVSLDVSQAYGPPWPVKRDIFTLFFSTFHSYGLPVRGKEM
jgi:hypothetical protein